MSLESNSARSICRIYASGKTCRFGDNCHFIHPQNHQDESLKEVYKDSSGTRTPSTDLCRSYQRTRFCKFGSKCRYRHILPDNSSAGDITQHDGSLDPQRSENLEGPSVAETAKPYFAFPLPNNGSKNDPTFDGKSGQSNPPANEYQRRLEECDRATPKDVRETNDPHGPDRIDSGQDHEGYKHSGSSGSVGASTLPAKPGDDPEHYYKPPAPGDNEEPGSDRKTEKSLGSKRAPKTNQAKRARPRLCRFYKAGHCTMGNRCRFWHPPSNPSDQDIGSNKENYFPARKRLPVSKPTEYDTSSLTSEEAEKIRRSEIELLLKRYPRASFVVDDPDSWSCQFTFTSSDPDWVFDVKDLVMCVEFPEKYPLQAMKIAVLEDQEMPAAVIRYARIAIKEWIEKRFEDFSKKGRTELMFRPFIRWLDRTLEDTFTEGLRRYKLQLQAEAAGVQFISGSELRERYTQGSSDGENYTNSEDSEAEDETEDEDDTDDEIAPQPSHVGELPPEGDTVADDISLDTPRKGTEVKVMKLQLEENAATLRPTKVRVILQCSRCKNKAELLTPCGRVNQLQCNKCSQSMLVNFRAGMAHQFSSIIGYMDVVNATVFDLILVDCHFELGCFNCSRDMRVEGLSVGQAFETFCHHCHKKMKVNSESVRFQQLQDAVHLDASDAVDLASKKVKKLPKDPAIQLGKPLPYEGTCKHYKKSFRWLRFPCCGKAYPCDVCHDENEGDHECAWANRMICGFCCKEQVYSAEKPCSGCGYSLTKKASSHWEGGKGCRDKIKMSKDDAKKYSNMSKTVSKRSQAKKEAKGSKTTKLRHS